MNAYEKVIGTWNVIIKRLMIKTPVERITLSRDQVREVCEEINKQWMHLVMTRAVFTNKDFPHSDKYESGGFYESKGIMFRIEVLKRSINFDIGASGLTSWHNKNFVIRLYGILEKYHILYSGCKAYKNEVMQLIFLLRPEIGAHGSGRKPKKKDSDGKRKLRKATQMINRLFPKADGKSYDVNAVEDYWLPIDGVLEKMKDKAIDFVQSLEKK